MSQMIRSNRSSRSRASPSFPSTAVSTLHPSASRYRRTTSRKNAVSSISSTRLDRSRSGRVCACGTPPKTCSRMCCRCRNSVMRSRISALPRMPGCPGGGGCRSTISVSVSMMRDARIPNGSDTNCGNSRNIGVTRSAGETFSTELRVMTRVETPSTVRNSASWIRSIRVGSTITSRRICTSGRANRSSGPDSNSSTRCTSRGSRAAWAEPGAGVGLPPPLSSPDSSTPARRAMPSRLAIRATRPSPSSAAPPYTPSRRSAGCSGLITTSWVPSTSSTNNAN